MSEHITHVAAFEDTIRLVQHSDAIPEPVKETIMRYYDSALCATASRGNHFFAVPFLEDVRARRPAPGEESAHDARLMAAALGWLVHRAVDHRLDDDLVPKLEEIRTAEGLSEDDIGIDEQQVYEDAVFFDTVYDGGRLQPRTPHAPLSPATFEARMDSHPGAASVDVEEVELLFGALWQQELLELHQFAADERDPEQWIETFLERRQSFSEDLRQYVEAYQDPDPEKMRHYTEGVNLYNESDPIIRLARALHKGEEPPPEIDLAEAVAAAETQSAYARALSQGYRNVEAAARYLDGAVGKSGLYDVIGMEESNRY